MGSSFKGTLKGISNGSGTICYASKNIQHIYFKMVKMKAEEMAQQ